MDTVLFEFSSDSVKTNGLPCLDGKLARANRDMSPQTATNGFQEHRAANRTNDESEPNR